jgi:cytoskeletal protein RodZ
MTRTGVMASGRPSTATAASMRRSPSRVLRTLSILAVLALALALLPAAALAASEPTSGYTTTGKTTTTTVSPSSGTAPSKEEKAAEPTPTTSTAPANEKASSLPFTGFDLRWDLGLGLALIVAGGSIVAVQRRQRRGSQH